MERGISFKAALVAILLMFGGVCNVVAQDRTSEDKTYHRKADFSFKFVDAAGTANVTLDAYYNTETKEYKIEFGDPLTKDSLKLSDPLNYLYFKKALNEKYNSAAGNTNAKTLADETALAVFYWIYSIKSEGEDQPRSGDLHFHHYAIIFPNVGEADAMSSRDREELLKKVEDSISYHENAIATVRIKLDKLFEAVINDDQRKSDGAKSSEYLKQYKLPGWDDTAGMDKLVPGTRILFEKYKKAVDAKNGYDNYLKTKNIYAIKSITLKIERGFLEDIHVKVGNQHFDLSMPIGISCIGNYISYSRMRLFIRKSSHAGFTDLIYLSDVLGEYDLVEELMTRDYSPGDTTINGLDPAKQPYVTFRRERQIRLFDSRIYTDLAGLDDKAPNGLVQVELSRRFNFNTHRRQYSTLRADYGLFNYVTITGTLSKIEEKQKRLSLRNSYSVVNNTITSPNYVTNLDLRRYENASLEMVLNPLLHNWKDGKTVVYFDFGIRYGHTPIVDSVKRINGSGQLVDPTIKDNVEFDGHTVTLFPSIKWEFLSERRVGFSLGYRFNYSLLFSNNRFKQVASEEKSNLLDFATDRVARKSHQVDLDVRILTSAIDDNFIFFRSRFYIQQGDANKFFPQFQLGYRYNLIFRK